MPQMQWRKLSNFLFGEGLRAGGVCGLRGQPTPVSPELLPGAQIRRNSASSSSGEPLAASPRGAPVRRRSGQVGDVQRHHPLVVSDQKLMGAAQSRYFILH
ncbi:hypothetical protein CDAR_569031 [Caerostris darwini]|uniref:Uncharacterized protein n=1 Tax=Caerostris darwini TaxID=1538125 RepID=A0AAV4QC73_9ARAC|nr:hypothetical protein CDAR_569031 [Caerostris darwini]